MHVNATLVQDRYALAQVVEATQDGPWNNLDDSPLAHEREERAMRQRIHEATRLAQELVLVHEMDAHDDWVPVDPYADVSAMWQNVHYVLREHYGVDNSLALAVVRELHYG